MLRNFLLMFFLFFGRRHMFPRNRWIWKPIDGIFLLFSGLFWSSRSDSPFLTIFLVILLYIPIVEKYNSFFFIFNVAGCLALWASLSCWWFARPVDGIINHFLCHNFVYYVDHLTTLFIPDDLTAETRWIDFGCGNSSRR